jgi:hypothetical protein
MRHAILIAASVFAIATLTACNPPAPAGATKAEVDAAVAEARAADVAEATKVHADASPAVYFVNLKDGDVVTSPFRVVFGVHGMGVAPAGVDKPNTGHHHLLVDTELTHEEMQFAIPNDEKHIHFGTGATERVLELPAGQHTLQLVFGDMNHELHKPNHLMSQKITVTVK